jgi:DNA-binding NtrC family response regulator
MPIAAREERKGAGRVLLAEPDAALRTPAAEALKRRGHHCDSPDDTSAVGRLLSEQAYDMLVIDLQWWRAVAHHFPEEFEQKHAGLCVLALQHPIKTRMLRLLPDLVELLIEKAVESAAQPGKPIASNYHELAQAIEETIDVLRQTKGAFRSKAIARLRTKLEAVAARTRGE